MSKQAVGTVGIGLAALAGGVFVVAKLASVGPEGAKAATPAAHHGVGGTGSFGRPSSPSAGPLPDAGPPPDAASATRPAGAASTQSTTRQTAGPVPEPTTAPATQPAVPAEPAAQGLLDRDRLTGDWFGFRPRLEDRGITVNSTLEANVGRTFTGGLDTASGAGSYLFNLTLSVDTAKLGLWSGGTFYVDGRVEDGKRDSLDGAFQATSRVYQPRRVQVSELWYEQKVLGDTVRFKAGKIDANTEFAHADNAAEFVNAGFSFSPTIADFPTDPDPATGLVAFAYPTEHTYLGYGVFDGALHDGIATGSRGPATLFGPPAGLFMIGEAGLKWTTASRLDGRLGVGGWGQTGTFHQFAGGDERGTAGAYLTGDQCLWRAHPDVIDDKQGVAAFLMLGEADAAVSQARFHLASGVTWTGPFASRPADVVGLGETWVRFGDDPALARGHSNEWAIECFYKAQVTPWLTCKPDLGFVRHPGGAAGVPDAVEGSVQFIASF
jgi:porin